MLIPMAIDSGPSGNRRKIDVSPEELWKKVSQQLSSKKVDSSVKQPLASSFDFSSIEYELNKKKRGEETKEEIYLELENSLVNTPLFEELVPIFSTNTSRKLPDFFPREPLVMFYNPEFYKNFDLDTLFFIFYYSKGRLQQTYAAINLKYYAWRFHIKYNSWFQRLDEPNLITADYEKGEFLFFDYETTWTYMKKSDFVFEYYYLEQNDYY